MRRDPAFASKAYLRDTLEAVAVTPASEAASLTPWTWAERPASHRRDNCPGIGGIS